MRARLMLRTLTAFCVAWLLLPASLLAGEVTLNDGTVLKGGYPIFLSTVGPKAPRPDPDKSLNLAIISLSESGAVRFYVSRHHAKGPPNRDADPTPKELFKLPEIKRPKPKIIEQVAGQIQATPWDGFGHRRVGFRAGPKNVELMQQIIELSPKYVKVTAMDFLWEFSLPTNSIPPDVLNEMLHKASKTNNADDRFSIARFYLEGEFYQLAQHELESIRADFPDRANQVDVLTRQLKQYLADQALRMLEERRDAGQHQYAFETAQRFLSLKIPDVSPVVMEKLKQSVAQTNSERAKMDDIRQLLGQLQAQLPTEQAGEVAPIRTVIAEGLHRDTLDRLAPFLELADAENRQPAEKLALALTGWILGPDMADTDLKTALRLWQARGLLIEYYRAEHPAERSAVVEKLAELESVGPRQVARLIPLLPPRTETPDLTIGSPFKVKVERRTGDEPEIEYEVLLPLEYHAGRPYPVIVALHAEGADPRSELRWWARQAQRFGYIVLAPEYVSPEQRSYDYSVDAHQAVLETVRDARRRFVIDSDRIFLGGHGIGGDAVFDIGYSHPDVFAGIMPITAMCAKFAGAYWENARQLPQYVMAGQLDRDAGERNTRVIDHMLVQRFPIIYAVFTGRGHEDFQAEDTRLFDWMSRQRRPKPPTDIEVKIARTTDNHFWWWRFSDFPAKFGTTGWPQELKGLATPMMLKCEGRKLKGDNVINLVCGAKSHSIWLFPDVVSFEKLLTVRLNGLQLYRQIPEPDITAMLEDYRLRGDRQQIAWGHLELSVGSRPAASEAKGPAAQRGQRLSLKPK